MVSRKLLSLTGIAIWSAVALTAAPHALPHRTAANVAIEEDSPMSNCSELHIHFGDRNVVYGSEERTITRAEAATLRIEAERNGGAQIQGWDKDTYGVTLCKAVEDGSDAQSTLAQIHLAFQSGKLSVTGPSSRDRWTAHLLVRTPKNASIDVQTNNGPLSLHHVDGTMKVRAQNGPITVDGCTGDLDLNSQNGPVTLENNSGKQHVRTENGPVTVSLSSPAWVGSGVDAHATNGPLTLNIPSGYQSGVLVESDGHSPFQCHASVCSEGRKTWEDDHKSIEFGSGPTIIRLSSVNGPISVH